MPIKDIQHDHPLCDGCRELERRYHELEQRVAKLEQSYRKLQQLHFGKQKPVDQDKRQQRSGKKKGASGTGRSRPDESKITNEEELQLETCPDDGHGLGNPVDSYDRIIEDIPLPHTPIVTRWEILRYWCPGCGRLVSGTVPGVIPGTRIGPNVLTYIVIERHRFRKPIRLIVESLSTYYSFEISVGEINNLLDRDYIANLRVNANHIFYIFNNPHY